MYSQTNSKRPETQRPLLVASFITRWFFATIANLQRTCNEPTTKEWVFAPPETPQKHVLFNPFFAWKYIWNGKNSPHYFKKTASATAFGAIQLWSKMRSNCFLNIDLTPKTSVTRGGGSVLSDAHKDAFCVRTARKKVQFAHHNGRFMSVAGASMNWVLRIGQQPLFWIENWAAATLYFSFLIFHFPCCFFFSLFFNIFFRLFYCPLLHLST